MEIKILEDRPNPLLKRHEYRFEVAHATAATPSRDAVRSEISKLVKAPKDRVIIERMQARYGTAVTHGDAMVYETSEVAKSTTREHILVRNGLKEKAAPAGAAPTAEAPAAPAKAEAPVEAPAVAPPAPPAEPKTEPKAESKPEPKAEHKSEGKAPHKGEPKAEAHKGEGKAEPKGEGHKGEGKSESHKGEHKSKAAKADKAESPPPAEGGA